MKTLEQLEIKNAEFDLSWLRRCHAEWVVTARSFKKEIEMFYSNDNERWWPDLAITRDYISFDCADRAAAMWFLQCFAKPGTSWLKRVESEAIVYYRSDIRMDGEKIEIRVSGVPPPPSCKFVEVEIDVPEVPAQPATKKKVRKMVCADSTVDVTDDQLDEIIATSTNESSDDHVVINENTTIHRVESEDEK